MMPSSGQIKLSQARDIALLGNPVSLGAPNIRQMADIPSGMIKMSNLYGKSFASTINVQSNDGRYAGVIGYRGISNGGNMFGTTGSIQNARVINANLTVLQAASVDTRGYQYGICVIVRRPDDSNFDLNSVKSVTVYRVDNQKTFTIPVGDDFYGGLSGADSNSIVFGTDKGEALFFKSDIGKDILITVKVNY